MTEAVVCPFCGRRNKVEADRIGQRGPCAGCAAEFAFVVQEPVLGRDGKIKLNCPSCGTKYRLRPEMAGRQVQCSCKFKISVPGSRTSSRTSSQSSRRAAGVSPPSQFGAEGAGPLSAGRAGPVAAGGVGPIAVGGFRASPSNAPIPLNPEEDEDELVDLLDRLDLDEEEVDEIPPPARMGAPPKKKRSKRRNDSDEVGDTGWKWWYFVIAGTLIIAFSVWQLMEGEPILRFGGRRRGPIGGLIMGTLSILIGLWSRPSNRDES